MSKPFTKEGRDAINQVTVGRIETELMHVTLSYQNLLAG